MYNSVLDEIGEIKNFDKGNMLSFCTEASKHYERAAITAEKLSLDLAKPENVIIAGMGGSGIGGEILKDWVRNEAPFPIEINRDYSLPGYAGKRSLVFVVSYSGETEESLGAFLDAAKKKCMICCISSGGSLLKFAEKMGYSFLRIPPGMPPRAALPYLMVPLLLSFEKMDIVSGVSKDLEEAVGVLKQVGFENSPENPVDKNFCKKLALGINETVPVIYGFGIFRGVAQRFKQQFNENSKIPSKWEFFSELDHNEIVGWEAPGSSSRAFSALFIRDENEPDYVRSRIEVTKALMQTSVPKMFEVWSRGDSAISRILSNVCIGDFTSVYLAILRKVDPTPVRTIAFLKEKIGQVGTRDRIVRELEKMAAK